MSSEDDSRRGRFLGSRQIIPEMLDHAPPEVARANLADLVRLFRWVGGHSIVRKLLAQAVQPHDAVSVLDIGAASGDTARTIREHYPAAEVTSLDYNAVNLGAAPEPKVLADAFHLPFRDGSFDIVFSSLFLHHFEDDAVCNLLRSFNRVARRAVLVADLERHILPLAFLKISKPMFGWGDITVHDGLLSVRAAFRAHELATVAAKAGLQGAVIRRNHPAFRLTLAYLK